VSFRKAALAVGVGIIGNAQQAPDVLESVATLRPALPAHGRGSEACHVASYGDEIGKRRAQPARQINKWILPQGPRNRPRGSDLSHQSSGHVNSFIANSALSGTVRVAEGPAMTQRPAKRIPTWLTIDVLVIVVSLAIIGIGIGIGIVP
jgi:hypothetical protein